MGGMLRERDVALMVRALQRLSDATDPGSFPDAAMEASAAVVPCEIATYNEVGPKGSSVRWWPDDSLRPRGAEAAITRYAHEHPLIAEIVRTGDGSARAISDFLTHEQFVKLHLYPLVFEPYGLVDQLAIGLPAPRPLIIAIALNRGRRGFAGRERLMANLMRPYLMQAHRMAHLARSLEAVSALGLHDRAAFALGGAGQVEPVTGPVPPWLPVDELFPRGRLDDQARAWLQRQCERLSGGLPALSRPLVRPAAGARWFLRLVVTKAGPVLVVTRGSGSEAAAEAAIASLGLTRRESEVLLRLSQGATNREIAAALRVSTSTVKRHLESSFRKLGVRHRSEAAALVVDTLAHT